MHDLTHRPGHRNAWQLTDDGPTLDPSTFLVIAGPCAVEPGDRMSRIAAHVATAGAGALRGGAWKPRTSPRSFQGLGRDGLAPLRAARDSSGLPIVTEVLDPRDVELAARSVDVLQVGARNMSNGVLLREIARSGMPVLLKRGFGATLEELLAAAEYVLSEGQERIMLVERGIRTFEPSTRFTLDLSAVPVLRERTHLPIIVDPSHAAGAARWVPDLSRAAAAVGADGLMVEVHDEPQHALSDGDQALSLDAFADLMDSLTPILAAVGRTLARIEPAAAAAGSGDSLQPAASGV